ncbi:sulfatase-like hydrolase/transferase [Ruficoccus sp. ZRK36]|uniref:sulfatase-like hydrolase/transferase n=1 Tax=Ruficoccus sp. ZRK36 TaxID=2866311 RepID=UPI001C72C72D|nr:sulfatase-like hydrolase/transferase [Ruficoccus sp. ZRK36]QYY35224.1 sulfatase-like hydrolase/transferase [Ruficoccus sp. ZRK36]
MKKPNILFILADDLGSWALGCAGNAEVRTPNIDRIAAKGLLLSSAYCVSPVCSPARASLITGKIPSQHGVHDWIRRGNSPGEAMDRAVIDYLAGQTTYTEILAEQGYTCALSGKWHLGNAPQPQKGHTYWKTHARGGGPYYNAPMICEGKEYEEPRYVTDVITDNALDFLNGYEGEEPFYLGVHYTAPHSPWEREEHPAEYYDPYYNDCPFASVPDLPMHPWQINTAPHGSTPELRRELLSGYYASITAMDAGIGQLLDTLEEKGVLEDTLIIFTGDNGMNMGHHGIYGKGNGTYPQNMFDTSVKVPFVLSQPGRVPVGEVSDVLFSHYDFLPSLLEYVGCGDETPSGLPGRSLSGVWTGQGEPAEAPLVVFDEYGPTRMIRSRKYKYVQRTTDHPDEFYDLCADPDEARNLIDEPEYVEQIDRMRDELDGWFARYVEKDRDGAYLPIVGRGQLDTTDKSDIFSRDWYYLKDRPEENGEPKV